MLISNKSNILYATLQKKNMVLLLQKNSLQKGIIR